MFNEFDKRMKSYENSNKLFLQKKTPVIIRIDGKAFHSFAKGLEKPFDAVLGECMAKTTEYLLNNISGCVFGYTQSDEISLLLVDYQTEGTEPWFDNNQQKLVSISAAMATLAFNRFWSEAYNNYYQQFLNCHLGTDKPSPNSIKDGINSDAFVKLTNSTHTLCTKLMTAIFDARAFNIPKEEVLNYFIWRQQDATKNSISMLAQAHFSHKQLQGKNGKDKQDMLMGIGQEKACSNCIHYKTECYYDIACLIENETKLDCHRRVCYDEHSCPCRTGDRNNIECGREIQGCKCELFEPKVKGINWNDIPTRFKRGVAVYKKEIQVAVETKNLSEEDYTRRAWRSSNGISMVRRNKSYIDYEMPILTQDREFIKGY